MGTKLKQEFERTMHAVYCNNVPLRIKAELEHMFMRGALHAIRQLTVPSEPEVIHANREALVNELSAFVETLQHRK